MVHDVRVSALAARDSDSEHRRIDARSIVTLIVFFAVNALVIFPLHIPLPAAVGRGVRRVRAGLLGLDDDGARSAPPSSAAAVSTATASGISKGAAADESGDVELAPVSRGHGGTVPAESLNGDATPAEEGDLPASSSSAAKLPPTRFTLGLATAPVAGVLLLLASTCIPGSVVRQGIVGAGDGGIRPYDIMTLFLSFAYISLSLDATGLLRFLAFSVAQRAARRGRDDNDDDGHGRGHGNERETVGQDGVAGQRRRKRRHKRAPGRALFTALYALFVILSLGVGNDPVVLSGTPFVAYFTTHAGIDPPTAFLFMQFQAANLASALLVSSNPTNLVLTASFHLSFLSFSAWTALPTVAAAAALYPALRFLFRRNIPREIAHTPSADPRRALTDPAGAVFNSAIFAITIVALVALSAVGLLEGVQGVWTVTAPAAIVVLARDILHDYRKSARKSRPATAPTDPADDKDESAALPATQSRPTSPASSDSDVAPTPPLSPPQASSHPMAWLRRTLPTVSGIVSRLPLPLLPFAFSMFILVDALEYTGWVGVWAGWWAAWARVGGTAGCIWLMGVVSVLGCNIFGTNIGVTVLLSRILVVWRDAAHPSQRTLYGSVLALAIGSNFGAYSFVFSASLAGLLWRDILAQKGLHVRARDFARHNAIPLAITLTVACLVVAAEVCVMY